MQLLYRLECRRRRKIGDISNEIWYRKELQQRLIILAANNMYACWAAGILQLVRKNCFSRARQQLACGRGLAEVPHTSQYHRRVDYTLPKPFAQF